MARRRRETRPLPAALFDSRLETGADGYEYEVRQVPGVRAVKNYRCPGCDQEIRPGTAHVVVWRPGDEDDRRHWHTPCWNNRANRGPTRRWS